MADNFSGFPTGTIRHFRLADHAQHTDYDDLFAALSTSSGQVIDRAQVEADRLIAAARKQADELIKNAEAQADELIQNADAQAAGIVRSAEAEADGIIQGAEAEAAEIVQNAEHQAAEIVRMADNSPQASACPPERAMRCVEDCMTELRQQLLSSVELVDRQWQQFLGALGHPDDGKAPAAPAAEEILPQELEEKVSAIARELEAFME